jgi:kynurenine formamidase
MPLPQEFVDLAAKVRNWGRWGPSDEIGTLNLLTPERVRAAASLARTGRTYSLALPLSEDGPQAGTIPGRINPSRTMLSVNRSLSKDPDGIRFSDDAVSMPLQCATHWDALAHVSYGGTIYNGFPADGTDERGAARCGIGSVKTLIGRGVLLDVARAFGTDRLPDGHAITPEELEAAETLGGINAGPGDIALIRTGHMQLFLAGERDAYATGDAPGPGLAAAAWFRERDLAAVATDSIAFEVWPCERREVVFGVHILDLVEIGLTQGQNFDLEALSKDCASDGVYEFFLDASPLPFVRGLGSPVNPVAIK